MYLYSGRRFVDWLIQTLQLVLGGDMPRLSLTVYLIKDSIVRQGKLNAREDIHY